MSERAVFLLQVLEKLGTPLLAAAGAVAARTESGISPTWEAERVAELLSRCVQVSVSLSGSMDLRDDNNGDSVRLSLAAVAARLLGDHFSATGKIPDEAVIKRLVAALEAVLTFADNFTPSAMNVARLENITPGIPLADESQIGIQYIGIFVPVVGAVARFPFGQPEKKLVQDIAARLIAAAAGLRRELIGDGVEKTAGLMELQILRGLAVLYVNCHTAETNRLMARDGNARGAELSIDPVWQAFESGVAMLKVLGLNAVPGTTDSRAATGGSGGGVAPAAPPPTPTPPPQTVPETEVAPQNQAGYNPMSFFKPPGKKNAES